MKGPSFQCTPCKRQFSTAASLAQHQKAANCLETPARLPLKQDELDKESQRKLFRAEQSDNFVTAIIRAGRFRQVGLEEDESELGGGAEDLEYFGPKRAQEQALERFSGSNEVTEADVIHVLRISGATEARRVARKLTERGFEQVSKTVVNRVLYNLEKEGKAAIDHVENNTNLEIVRFRKNIV